MSVDPGGLESGSDPQDPVIDFDEESTLDDNEVLDPIDEGDGDNDPDASIYDTSWVPDDRPSHRTDYGDTLTEMREGEPLDRRLAEDEPDLLEQELGDPVDQILGQRRDAEDDPDFVDWPLGERSTVEALQAWSAAGRSMVLLAQRFDVFAREHARFVHWRRMWSHIIDARACQGPGLPPVPSSIWTPGWFLHRVDLEHVRGTCGRTPEARRALRERIDECLRHARPAFPASTLGL